MHQLHRAVVTGLGAVTPIGNTCSLYWDSLCKGISGAGPITRMDISQFKTKFACEVKNFETDKYFETKEIKTLDLYSQYGIASAVQAIEDSQLKIGTIDPYRIGVIFASGIGGLQTLQDEIINFTKQNSKPRFSPFMITKMISNMAAGLIAIRYDFRGLNYSTVSACASSTHALIDALNMIRLGKADVIIVGGSEAPITHTALGGFSSMKALSERNDDPQHASRPFDKQRDGFVMGEGGATIVLESMEHALKRGAHIYAEFAGGAMTADAFHTALPQPEGRSVYQAMYNALEDAEIPRNEVDYINLHATSTPAGDIPELLAVKKLCEQSLGSLHVSGTKSMTGHLLGAAGAIEAVASILALHHGIVPPTINTTDVDPAIDPRINLTLHSAVKKEMNVVMSNTFGFGGQNAVVVFKKFK